ncbi:Crp/Fnr family transcriptional regulator [Dyadobacter sp. CY327]|uniref:Crp/Fnr family transcriptional regulator n=1 Tax=Dyadobacter sp. CY327 TaxID=2907301 RepID=UPI001F1C28B0|nr:Crp/Fnr family transcriptional regulator [Dyadobacter sp. CY327]MCE7072587.1 Crp/Fnr family transcriptional regulator [Dyadobacter sp. CY327]
MNSCFDENLRQIISGYALLTHASLNAIVENCTVKSLKKDEYLVRQQRSDAHEYFLIDGIIQRSKFDSKDQCVTIGFYMPGSALTPHYARTDNGMHIFNLQALTDCTLAKIPVNTLDSLRFSDADIRFFGQKVVEAELFRSIAHEISFRSLNAKERLIALRSDYPNIENRVAHSVIASYLGITPVSFSRLRNELANSDFVS